VRGNSRGFTLIEVSIATGLLVVIALGTAQMFALAIHQNMAAKDQLLMTIAAARKIDQLTASAAAGGLTASSPADALDRAYDGFSDDVTEAGAVYVRRWSITFRSDYGGRLAAIAVRVRRPAGGSDVQIATLTEVKTP
jgi:prepilin-type N-terminal cleavage/methylation domain-containing protein